MKVSRSRLNTRVSEPHLVGPRQSSFLKPTGHPPHPNVPLLPIATTILGPGGDGLNTHTHCGRFQSASHQTTAPRHARAGLPSSFPPWASGAHWSKTCPSPSPATAAARPKSPGTVPSAAYPGYGTCLSRSMNAAVSLSPVPTSYS